MELGALGYVFDGLEGEGGVAEEYAGGPGALGVGAAAAGGGRVREARGEGAGEGRGDEGEERDRGAEVGGRGGRVVGAPALRRRRRPRGRRHRRLEMGEARLREFGFVTCRAEKLRRTSALAARRELVQGGCRKNLRRRLSI